MSVETNFKQSAPFYQYTDTDKIAAEKSSNHTKETEDQGKQVANLSNHSSAGAMPQTYPLTVVEAIFIECLRLGGTRESQSLACLNTSFNENMRTLVCKQITKISQSVLSSKCILLKVKTIIPDKRADKIFKILNTFLVWSRHVKMGFFLANNPQEAYSIDQKKYYSVIAGDFSSDLIPDTLACLTLNNLSISIHHYLANTFPGKTITFSYSPILSDGSSMVSQLDLFNRIEALFDAASAYVINLIGGCTIIDPDFKIRYQDVNSQEVHTMDILPYTCINYAFYHLREPKAQPIVFENYMFEKMSDMFSFLINVCRYRPVHKAEKGDLICYFNRETLTHFAVAEGPDTVHSKWNQLKPALSHPIKFVPEEYGRKVIVLRKTNTAENKPWEFDSEEMGSKKIRGHENDNYFELKFTGSKTGSKPKTTFSKYMTLCNRSFILYGIQDIDKPPSKHV